MKAKPYKRVGNELLPCEPSEATEVRIMIPGPMPLRRIPVIIKGKRNETNCWSWNGDTEKPTFKPSVLTRCGEHLCHSFVNDGLVKFLSDCSHEYAGKTMELLDVEE